MLDGGVVVFSAREGVEAQSETVWHQADKYRVPRIAMINKMDREGADFFGTLDEIRERLNCRPIPVNLPVGAGPPHVKEAFRGLIDLVSMRMLTFAGESEGVGDHRRRTFPPSCARRPSFGAAQMLDQLSMYSDELTELLLAESPVPAELVRRGAPRGDDPQPGRCRCSAARRWTASACSRCWTPWPVICPARPTCRRSKASIPKKPEVKLVRKPEPGRAVLRPGLQDSGRPARRSALRPHLFRHVEGQQPGLQSGQGQEGERAAVVAHPGRPPRRRSSGRRPATSSASSACATRSPATRFAAPRSRSCWNRSPFPKP